MSWFAWEVMLISLRCKVHWDLLRTTMLEMEVIREAWLDITTPLLSPMRSLFSLTSRVQDKDLRPSKDQALLSREIKSDRVYWLSTISTHPRIWGTKDSINRTLYHSPLFKILPIHLRDLESRMYPRKFQVLRNLLNTCYLLLPLSRDSLLLLSLIKSFKTSWWAVNKLLVNSAKEPLLQRAK